MGIRSGCCGLSTIHNYLLYEVKFVLSPSDSRVQLGKTTTELPVRDASWPCDWRKVHFSFKKPGASSLFSLLVPASDLATPPLTSSGICILRKGNCEAEQRPRIGGSSIQDTCCAVALLPPCCQNKTELPQNEGHRYKQGLTPSPEGCDVC